jgi:uncharacterized protein (TIGR02145 family)
MRKRQKHVSIFLVLVTSCFFATAQKRDSVETIEIVARSMQQQTLIVRNEVKEKWMQHNLAVTAFRNGDTIFQAQSDDVWISCYNNQRPCWCYYEKNLAGDKTNEILYNFYAVTDKRGLAPIGWHIPSVDEWKLIGLEDMTFKNTDLKYWFGTASSDSVYCINEAEFSAKQDGNRNYMFGGANFSPAGRTELFWTATESDIKNGFATAFKGSVFVFVPRSKGNGFAVRCVRN